MVNIPELSLGVAVVVALLGVIKSYGNLRADTQKTNTLLEDVLLPDVRDLRAKYVEVEHRVTVMESRPQAQGARK
jgi:uncharacterized membrane protein YfbV (UPF0208 family)